MYISSNWILAKALRTVLSMLRGWGGAGLSPAGMIPAVAQRAAPTAGLELGVSRRSEALVCLGVSGACLWL